MHNYSIILSYSLATLASAPVFAEEAKPAGIAITSSAARNHFIGSQQTFTGLEYVDRWQSRMHRRVLQYSLPISRPVTARLGTHIQRGKF